MKIKGYVCFWQAKSSLPAAGRNPLPVIRLWRYEVKNGF
jgi:hypothetical protein